MKRVLGLIELFICRHGSGAGKESKLVENGRIGKKKDGVA